MAPQDTGVANYDIFLSHNRAQKDWTHALALRLRNKGYKIFFDQWEMPRYAGRTWIKVLAECIDRSKKVILVWSPEFFKNQWPQFEANILQRLDPIGSKGKILPIIHTECDLPTEFAGIQGLPFTVVEDSAKTAVDGTIEFEFRYQQLLHNLNPLEPYEGDFEQFKRQQEVLHAGVPPLNAEDQIRRLCDLRSVMYQAPRYTTPTYFLDTHLAVVAWNVAFELIFRRILPAIRRRHVNDFIHKLANRNAVFEHARKFTEKVKEEGHLPLVDMEPLVYESPDYGEVEFIKVATQLTDAEANLKAWSVALLPKKIDWKLFQTALEKRLREDRLWGVYAVSYDALLRGFKPYEDLIQDVISGIPAQATRILELGAGTGNVTEKLLLRNYRVMAVENNPFMLEKMSEKRLSSNANLTVLMEAVENTEFDGQRDFDAVVAVNVAYALDDPPGCFRKVAEALRRGGVFTLSTTHRTTNLDALLEGIRDDLVSKGKLESCREHYDRLVSVNRDIEKTIARRHPLERYKEWLVETGFEIVRSEPKYFDAVEMIHACKR